MRSISTAVPEENDWTTRWQISNPCCICGGVVPGVTCVMENESMTIQRTVEWGLFSAFSLGDRAEGIDETGFQYPLENAVLTAEFPLGVSNHILEPEATIRVRRGALAVGWQLAPLSEK